MRPAINYARIKTNINSIKMTPPTVADVAAFIALRKSLVRIMEWTNRPSLKSPQWMQFESKCFIGSDISEDVDFRAHYRPSGTKSKGLATIDIPEAFYVSISICEHRVFAIDTLEGQKHTNVMVPGRPFSGKKIDSTTHVHIWANPGADKYVEPIFPPMQDLEQMITDFCFRVNLSLNGPFKHPLFNKNMDLSL